MDGTQQKLQAMDWQHILPPLQDVLSAFGILILSWVLARWAARLINSRLGNNKGLQINDTVRPVIATIAKYTIILAALYAALTMIGIPATSLLAVFGAAGLAIALAVQGTLANIASGVMLIFLRSMEVGEYIQTPKVEGTVLEIGLFTTQFKSPAGLFITVPNAQIWGDQIINFSRFKSRRVDIVIEIDRDNDLRAALNTLNNVARSHPLVIDPDTAKATLSGLRPTTAQTQTRLW